MIDRAIADYDGALRLDPTLADIFNARGELWRKKGDRPKALADFAAAIKLNPDHPTAKANHKSLAQELERLGALMAVAGKPSFNCATAQPPVEKAICANPELADLDREINGMNVMVVARSQGSPRKRAALQREQDEFIARRNAGFGRPGYDLRKAMKAADAAIRGGRRLLAVAGGRRPDAAAVFGLNLVPLPVTMPEEQFAGLDPGHGRACPGHSRLAWSTETWMPGTRPGMTTVHGSDAMNIQNNSRYHEVHARSLSDPEGFWAEAAREIDWIEPAKKVFDPSMGAVRPLVRRRRGQHLLQRARPPCRGWARRSGGADPRFAAGTEQRVTKFTYARDAA